MLEIQQFLTFWPDLCFAKDFVAQHLDGVLVSQVGKRIFFATPFNNNNNFVYISHFATTKNKRLCRCSVENYNINDKLVTTLKM